MEVGTRIGTKIEDCDTDNDGNERLIPIGTLGTVTVNNTWGNDIIWDNDAWTVWTDAEIEADAEVLN